MRKQIRRMRQPSSNSLLLLLAIAAMPSFAQDMKPLSSLLAKSISASGRKTVAVVDFTDLQGNITELGRFLAEELSVDLVGDAKAYEVIERNQLRIILQEHRLSATGLIDPQTAKKLGQIAGVDALVTGTITAFGDTVRLSAKVLDTQTARMLGAATLDIPKTKRIEDMAQIGIAGAGAPPNEGPAPHQPMEPKSVAASVEENDLLFVVKSCGRSGETLKCIGFITNKARRTRSLSLVEVKFLDNLGNEYPAARVSLPAAKLNFGIPASPVGFFLRAQMPIPVGVTAELEPDLPVNFLAGADHTDLIATGVTLIVTYQSWPSRPSSPAEYNSGFSAGKLVLRNVPIKRTG